MNLPLEPIPAPGSDDGPRDGETTFWPCGVIEPLLGSHLDRELTRAEEARVEEHLDTCDRCRARLEHLEALSGVLKGWEAAAITPVPPDLRLRNSVLARVAETSHQRRVDDRVLRMTHLAVAACVLVALGLGIVLGTGWEPPLDDTPGAQDRPLAFHTDAASLPSARLGTRGRFDRDTLKAKTSLDGIASDGVAPIEPLPRLRAIQSGVLSRTLAQRAQLEMQRVTGQASVVLPGRNDDAIVITRDILDSPSLERVVSLWRPKPVEPASVAPVADAGRTTPRAVLGEATGKTVTDLLQPMQGLNGDVNSFLSAPPVFVWKPTLGGDALAHVGSVEARGIHRSRSAERPPLASTDGTAASTPIDVLDPLKAQENGQLWFEDEDLERDAVVVRVSGTTGPIFIPAGQVLSGGVTDRVTAQPLWIPTAARGELRFRLACMPIRRGPDRVTDGRRPQLTRWIVGPSLRSLLARGTTPQIFLDAAERQFQASGQVRPAFGEFSLLAVLQDAAAPLLDARREWSRTLQDDRYAGFVFTRASGEVLGLEVVRFTGDAASKLLARLWASYQLEAWLRAGISASDTRTLARPARPLEATLRRLQRSTDVFQGKVGEQQLLVSRVDVAGSRLSFHAVEIGGRAAREYTPLYVSGTARLDLR